MSTESPVPNSDLITAVDEKISTIRTRSLDISFNELVDMYDSNELTITPEYQRLFRWDEGSQSRLIESLVLEMPLPPIFLLELEEGVYELIDGLQRISSYLHFRGKLKIDGELQDKLKLVDCDIVEELNGLTYDELPRAVEIKLKRNFIRAEILRKESDSRLRYYMFKRLNTGGARLEEQEIRNCTIRLLNPDFNELLIQLSKSDDFKSCISTVSEEKIGKKYDQELVLRFFAFKNNRSEYVHNLADFLTEYMESVSDPDVPVVFDYTEEARTFHKTFAVLKAAADAVPELADQIFGSVFKGKVRSQFAVYHFDAITLGIQPALDSLDPSDQEAMRNLGEKILSMKKDLTFAGLTGGGRNTQNFLSQRIAFAEKSLSGTSQQ